MKPSDYYRQDTERQGYQQEPGQRAILDYLDSLQGQIQRGRSIFGRGWQRSPKGIYIHGGVGRGKTYLLNIFHQTAPPNSTLRMHFHSFVRDIHQRLQALPKSPNPVPIVARQIAKQARVLCLDELFVDDIADAMLLVGLFPALGEQGVSLVTTSNIEPDRLYENGLQRLHFLQAIDWLKEHTEVVSLDHATDFRHLENGQSQAAVFPMNTAGLEEYFIRHTETQRLHRDGNVWLQGRSVPFLMQSGNSGIMFDFHTLCATHRSVRDYLELAEHYKLVALRDVYMMGEQQDDVAKRFMHLVDALYDANVGIALSVEAPLEAIYQGRRLQHNFVRTLSRLYEMTRGENGLIARL